MKISIEKVKENHLRHQIVLFPVWSSTILVSGGLRELLQCVVLTYKSACRLNALEQKAASFTRINIRPGESQRFWLSFRD